MEGVATPHHASVPAAGPPATARTAGRGGGGRTPLSPPPSAAGREALTSGAPRWPPVPPPPPAGRRQDEDHTLARFLKARQWDVKKAFKMYKDTAAWRAEFGTQELRADGFDFPEVEEVQECYPTYYHKTDKFGRPVYIEELGACQVDKLLKCTDMDRMLKYHIAEWEKLTAWRYHCCSTKEKRKIFTSTTIMDLKGLALKNFNKVTRNFVSTIAKVDQDNYPEHLGTMFIINAPFIFTTIWAFVKPLLDKRTTAKIHVLGTKYMDQLKEFIEPENIPGHMGGLCQCGGKRGCRGWDAGPWRDKAFKTEGLEFPWLEEFLGGGEDDGELPG